MKKIRIENPNILDKRRAEWGHTFLLEYLNETDDHYKWQGYLTPLKNEVRIIINKNTVKMYDPNNFTGYDAIRIVFWDYDNIQHLQKEAVIRNLRIAQVRDVGMFLFFIYDGMKEVLEQS